LRIQSPPCRARAHGGADEDALALALLSAEQAYQLTLLARVQAQASRLADTAALFQALGGGW
jgi:outer membrane protein TolC